MGFAAKLLSKGSYILYNLSIAHYVSAEAAILLGCLCDLAEQYGSEFYYQQPRLIELTGLSEYMVRSATKQLVEIGVLRVAKKGMPAKHFYSIDADEIVRFLSGIRIDTTSGQSCTVVPHSQNKIQTRKDIALSNRTVDKPKVEKPSKGKYGSSKNVFLSDDEVKSLSDMFPDWQERIENASAYLAAKGDKYVSHYKMLLYWDKLEKEKSVVKSARKGGRDYDYDYT